MNPDLAKLHPYPFERLRALLAEVQAPAGLAPIDLSIGEPRHPPPARVVEELITHLHGLARYPLTRGGAELRTAIADWARRRFDLPALDPERQVLPVNGTREALFAVAQALVDRSRDACVLMPNPFYQIYEGAALLAGATPYYLDTPSDQGYLPDFEAVPARVWQRCQLVYVCTPGNPTGAVFDQARFEQLLALADRHDFVIASDECYSEIYPDEQRPPAGLLGACARSGRDDYARCLVFHSLSKRSNLPGLRSGFVAGDARLIQAFLRYRTYHGCAMPPPAQAASIVAWRDEDHVRANRDHYRRKFDQVSRILQPVLPVTIPDGGFYLWLPTPGDDRDFAREVHARCNVTLLPGSFLSRAAAGRDPGAGHVRMALVATEDDCTEAAGRIRALLQEKHGH